MDEKSQTPAEPPKAGAGGAAISDTGTDLTAAAGGPPPGGPPRRATAALPAGDPPSPPPAGTPPPPPATLIGSTVSHYRILERLGGGGMGVVYKAWDTRLERFAALKFLSPQRSGNDDFKRRFTREARTASRLEHANICTVFESDQTEDARLYIAMAFCEGESLKRRIERGPLPLGQALAIAAQVASGLAAAHDKGIVHRDIKPGNIMVAEDGRVKIVDFGIARLADQTRLTRTGDLMGTTAYVAPEQFLAEDSDHRADLWSLGVVIYEMITGRLPWTGSDERELVNAIVKRPLRPVSALRLDVPQALERLLARALAKRPADRCQTAGELRADLLAVAELVAPGGGASAGEPVEETVIDAAPGRRAAGTGAAAPGPPPVPAVGTEGAPDRGAGTGLPPAVPATGTGAGAAAEGAPRTGGTGGMIGRIVAHYRILSALGGGGMGVVYKAQDLALERVVALKFLPPELTRDPDSKSRFRQEARAASALDHPNICTIHEVGETDEGQLFLAMACYEGETLKQRLQGGKLAIDESVEVAQQVARGLVKAHRHGIVHRDIKPANLMITTDDIVKILDFGIAKLVGSAGLTRTGSSLGTPGYMSPEQARGEEVDPRTDVWSLGAVLYEMVTGRRPFRGEHEQTVLYSLFNEEPEPVAQLRPDAPPELVRIIGRMLAKDADLRYPTAAAALSDLRALYGPVTGTLTGSTAAAALAPAAPAALAAGRSRRRRLPLPAAAALLALLLAALVYGLLRPRAPDWVREHPSFTQQTDLPGQETYPSISPGGDYFAYTKVVNGRSHIFTQRVGGHNPIDLTKDPSANDTQPAWSPDGDLIAFRSDRNGGGIFVMGASGESVKQLTADGFNPSWSPEGEIAYATEGVTDPAIRTTKSAIWRINVTTLERHLVFAGDGVQPNWSPHGNRIAYWAVGSNKSGRELWTIPAAGGKPTPALSDDNFNWDPVWSPDGKILFFASNRSGTMSLWWLAIDEASGRVGGEPESLGAPGLRSAASMSFARQGQGQAQTHRFVYATDEKRSAIERIPFDPRVRTAGAAEPILSDSRKIFGVDASPDGNWLAFATETPQESIWVLRLGGNGESQLTPNDAYKNRVPRWSPDGRQLAFYSNRGGAMQIWAMRPDGSELQKLSPATQVYGPVWSPHGNQLACTVGVVHSEFCLIDLTVPFAQRLPQPQPQPAAGIQFQPFSWSPDGRRLAGLTEEQPGIFIYSVAARSFERITSDHEQWLVWLHDNRTVLFLRNGAVMVADADTRIVQQVLAPPAHTLYQAVTTSPDDRSLYALGSAEDGHIYLGTFDRPPIKHAP